MLAASLAELIRTINHRSGRLPVEAVVVARHVTDVLAEIIDGIADDAVPDVQAVVAVRGIVRDYLPTTLDRFLALDPATAARPLPDGRTPAEQLAGQLDDLATAAGDVLTALRARDASDLVAQGSFLHTKFSRSDLDL